MGSCYNTNKTQVIYAAPQISEIKVKRVRNRREKISATRSKSVSLTIWKRILDFVKYKDLMRIMKVNR
jgi:hypothetical protein